MSATEAGTVYIDCTNTYFDRYNNGIFRVVRNLVQYSPGALKPGGFEARAVVFYDHQYYIVPMSGIFEGQPPERAKGQERQALWYWMKLLSVVSVKKARRKHYRKLLKSYAKDFYLKKAEEVLPLPLNPLSLPALSKKDWLILPEIVREDQCKAILNFKIKGKVACIIHDVIPITHPEYFANPGGASRFYKFMVEHADKVVAVSKYSAECFRSYGELLRTSGVSSGEKKMDWVHLGCDLDLARKDLSPSREIMKVYENGMPIFLVCATIEPRKNHLTVLDAFDLLWRDGCQAGLVFIGGYGWDADEILQRVRKHPELNRRLFWFCDSPEADLHYAYQKSRALICASYVEGFGLPLVEALALGRDVLFSNIDSFREIVPEELMGNSFDPRNHEELARLVLKTLNEKEGAGGTRFAAVTWKERVGQFYSVLGIP